MRLTILSIGRDRSGLFEPAAHEYLTRLQRYLQAGADGAIAETSKPGDARLARATTEIIATPARSLEAAAALAHQHGYDVRNLGDRIEGEARAVARVWGRGAPSSPARPKAEGRGSRYRKLPSC